MTFGLVKPIVETSHDLPYALQHYARVKSPIVSRRSPYFFSTIDTIVPGIDL